MTIVIVLLSVIAFVSQGLMICLSESPIRRDVRMYFARVRN